MRYGIKLWSTNYEWFSEAVERYKNKEFDFIELYVVPGSFDEEKLRILKEIPVNIHAPHFKHNFNLMLDNENNIALFEEVKKFANFFNSDYIVVHPGVGDDFSILKKNLTRINNKQLIIENMPYRALNGKVCYGYSLEQMEKIMGLGFGSCLDFSHAVKSAISQKIDTKKFLKQLMMLKPKVFHISDGNSKEEKDEHLDLGEGNFDLRFIKNLILNSHSPTIVFETPKKNNNLKNDMKNINYFKQL